MVMMKNNVIVKYKSKFCTRNTKTMLQDYVELEVDEKWCRKFYQGRENLQFQE